MHSFERAGLASLDDFDAPGYGPLFAHCAAAQEQFLQRSADFFGPEYRWERDALHQWSRCWEYPYTLHHLSRFAQAHPGASLADFGCGITFFPVLAAQLGASVTAIDVDAAVVRDMQRAASVFGLSPRLRAVANSGVTLPFADASFDALYSISVLEHIPEPQRAVAEIARVVKPGGLLLVTMDIDLKGDAQLSPAQFSEFIALCETDFERSVPDVTVHPRRVLTCYSGPYARSHQEQVPGIMLRSRDGTLRPLLGGPIAPDVVDLACYGAVFRRKTA